MTRRTGTGNTRPCLPSIYVMELLRLNINLYRGKNAAARHELLQSLIVQLPSNHYSIVPILSTSGFYQDQNSHSSITCKQCTSTCGIGTTILDCTNSTADRTCPVCEPGRYQTLKIHSRSYCNMRSKSSSVNGRLR